MTKTSNQRIVLSDAHDYQVRQIALREGRTITNALTKLIGEAIDARRKADASVDKLVAIIRGTADAEAGA
jgi:hypothetical protein